MINSRVSIRGTGNHLGRKIDIVLEAQSRRGRQSLERPGILWLGSYLRQFN